MQWLETAMNLAKQFEGCKLEAYPDLMYGWRKATIGYGATGPSITQGVVWTQDQADADLDHRMTGCGEVIDRLVKVTLNDDQKGALADFIYNVGEYAFDHSTMLAKLNVSDYAGAAAEFPRWNLSDGVVLAGLTKRRKAEQAVFLGKSKPQQEESQ